MRYPGTLFQRTKSPGIRPSPDFPIFLYACVRISFIYSFILILYILLAETTADDADSDYERERDERLHNDEAELEKADLDRDSLSDGMLKFASLFSKKEMGVQMAMAKFGVQRAKRNVVLRKSCLNQVVCLCVYVLGKGNGGRCYVVSHTNESCHKYE